MSETCPCGNRADHNTNRCKVRATCREVVTRRARATGVPEVTALDLWAHLRAPGDDGTDAAHAVLDVLDLGWRPVVGSDTTRLWSKP